MVEGTENKLTQIEHIMKAINLSKGFYMSLSGTDQVPHTANTASCFKKNKLFTLVDYSLQISGFALIRNTPIKAAPQTGNNLADHTKKKKTKPQTNKETHQKTTTKRKPNQNNIHKTQNRC